MGTFASIFSKTDMSKSLKKTWYWLNVLSLICAAIALGLYVKYGATSSIFVTRLNKSLVAALIIGIVLCAVSVAKTFREVQFVSYLVFLYSAITFAVANIELFGGMIYGEETAVMPSVFVVIFALICVDWIAMLTAGIMNKPYVRKDNDNQEGAE